MGLQMNQPDGGYETALLDNRSAIGRVYYNLGDYRESLIQFSSVLQEAEKNHHREVRIAILNDRGLLYMDQADFKTAAELFFRSFNSAKETGDLTARTTGACNLGVVNER